MRSLWLCCALTAALAGAGCATTGSGGSSESDVPWPPESMADEWSFSPERQGHITMSRIWPYGASERRLYLVVEEGSLTPLSGTTSYSNQQSRPMTKGELHYFWEFGGARQAYERRKQKEQ